MSLARNNGSLIVPFITISVCIVFVVNALTISMIEVNVGVNAWVEGRYNQL